MNMKKCIRDPKHEDTQKNRQVSFFGEHFCFWKQTALNFPHRVNLFITRSDFGLFFRNIQLISCVAFLVTHESLICHVFSVYSRTGSGSTQRA